MEQSQPEDPGQRKAGPRDRPEESSAIAGLGMERRAHPDRRGQPTSVWSAFAGARRRRHGRRTGEEQDIYVDIFQRRDVALLILIFVLNILDALFTLLWLQRGGVEANPFMAWILGIGNWAFLAQKCFVVGLWLVLLLVHKNFRMARLGLWSAASLYALLILYHFVLIASGVDPRGHDWVPEQARLEQMSQQGGYGGLDAQWAQPQTYRAQPGALQTIDLEVAPAAFGTYGNQAGPGGGGEPDRGLARMGDPAAPLTE